MISELEKRRIIFNFSDEQRSALKTAKAWVDGIYKAAKPQIDGHFIDHIQRITGAAGKIAYL